MDSKESMESREAKDSIKSQVEGLLGSRPRQARHLLAVLQDIQAAFRYLPKEALLMVSEKLEVSAARVFAVAGFYKALSFSPKAERLLTVCQGTACHLRGSEKLIQTLESRLGFKIGQSSTDGRLGLETVNCLGACALAPVATVDGAVHGHLTPEKALDLI
ncbi:MAG: NAD(P)H-dependent oxidoreductase subunit E [Deltaproteobacteria bacterium]|nr:NAD(P)H-dependent oxidoreductase subunit E [Deltaproteobacteria bacterium]